MRRRLRDHGARWSGRGACARLPGRRPVLWLLPALVLLGLVGGPGAARPDEPKPPELAPQRAKIEQLRRERTAAEHQLARFEASEEELQSEITHLADLVRASRQRQDALQQRIGAQQRVTDAQARELARLKREIAQGRERIGQRLHRLYRMTKLGRSAALFQVARHLTFAKDSHYVALLQEADRQAIAQYEALNADLVEKQAQVERTLERLLTLREELDEETALLAERRVFLRTSLRDAARNRELYGKYLRDLERMMSGMEATIARLEQEAKARQVVPSKPAELRGTLPAPAAGAVIARFGEQDPRYDDLKKRQRGVVLRVAPYAPVAAVAPGRVVHAGPFRGYQALVVLEHGGGLFTVYGHLERLEVGRGEHVPQGRTLGRATYQPVQDAYDVYFEVRYNGQPDDPQHWIAPGRLRNAPTNGSSR